MSLKGFRLRAAAKSRTMTGGFRWMIFTSPWIVTTGAADDGGSGRGNDGPRAGRGGGAAGALAASAGAGTGAGRDAGPGPGRTREPSRRGAADGIGETGHKALGRNRPRRGRRRGLGDGQGIGARAGAASLATVSRSRATSWAVFTKIPAGAFDGLDCRRGRPRRRVPRALPARRAAFDANSFSISST